jgi:hypothetical protein
MQVERAALDMQRYLGEHVALHIRTNHVSALRYCVQNQIDGPVAIWEVKLTQSLPVKLNSNGQGPPRQAMRGQLKHERPPLERELNSFTGAEN